MYANQPCHTRLSGCEPYVGNMRHAARQGPSLHRACAGCLSRSADDTCHAMHETCCVLEAPGRCCSASCRIQRGSHLLTDSTWRAPAVHTAVTAWFFCQAARITGIHNTTKAISSGRWAMHQPDIACRDPLPVTCCGHAAVAAGSGTGPVSALQEAPATWPAQRLNPNCSCTTSTRATCSAAPTFKPHAGPVHDNCLRCNSTLEILQHTHLCLALKDALLLPAKQHAKGLHLQREGKMSGSPAMAPCTARLGHKSSARAQRSTYQ